MNKCNDTPQYTTIFISKIKDCQRIVTRVGIAVDTYDKS